MIARKSMFIVITQFFMRFIGWVSLVLMAILWKAYAPEALGMISFAMSFLGLFTFISDLGFNSAHIKRVSEGKDLGTCLGTYVTIKVILTCAMVAVVMVGILLMKYVLHQGFHDATTESVVYVFLIYYVFMNLAQISLFTFEGKREMVKRQIAGISENIIKVPLSILVALAGVSIAGVVSISPIGKWPSFIQSFQEFLAKHAIGSLSIAYASGGIAVFLVGIWFLRKNPLKRPSRESFKSYYYFAMPLMFISFIGTISTNIDKVMIGYFWTATEVGYYYSVQQILQIFFIFSYALGIVLFPTLSEYHAKKDFEKIKQTTLLSERYLSMMTIPVIVVIILFVHPVISIMLSSAFLPAASVLIVLLLYTFVTNLILPYNSLITGMDKPRMIAKIVTCTSLLNIGLNLLFIPKGGLLSTIGINGPTGAATATLISAFVLFVWIKFSAKKLIGINLLQSHTPRQVLAGIGMGIVLYYINIVTPLYRWYHLIAFSLVGLGIYLVILFVLKEFTKRDLKFFLSLLHPKEMLNDITSELKTK